MHTWKETIIHEIALIFINPKHQEYCSVLNLEYKKTKKKEINGDAEFC